MSCAPLYTDRLVLRRWRNADIAPFAAICADEEVMRYIGDGSTRTREQAAASVARFESDWEKKGYGLYAVAYRDDDRLIGFAGFSQPDFLPEIMPSVEIGWRFGREHWGHGYATEAAREALKYGLDELRLTTIVSVFQSANEASRRIVRKLGMQFDRQTCDPSCGRPVEVYRTPPG